MDTMRQRIGWACVAIIPLAWMAGAAPTVWVPSGAEWRYADVSVTEGWQRPGFDDSGWNKGTAPLGYSPNGEDGEKTTLSYGTNEQQKTVTYYFRKKFQVAGDKSQVRGRVRADDGVVVYLNGKEVWRNLMPEGAITHTTLATAAVPVETRWYDFPLEGLQEGENCLAAEVHQASVSSSDLGFDLALAVDVPERASLAEGQPVTIALPGGERMEFVWIPAVEGGMATFGHLNMRIDRGYWLGKYEVTQAQWASLMTTNPARFRGALLPVEGIAWEQANSYCQMMNGVGIQLSGWPVVEGEPRFRLPNEGEWEYACIGTAKREIYPAVFSIGGTTTDLARTGWYLANSGGATHPVGQLQPNAWGLHDMLGNVWEYCGNWKASMSSLLRHTPRENGVRVFDMTTGTTRAIRGGSWFNTAMACQVEYRGPDASVAGGSVGFRVALVTY